MRLLVAAAGVCLAFAAAARPAAACSKRHQTVFELFELARDVAVVKVGAVPGARYAGPVALAVKRRLKGSGRRLIARATNKLHRRILLAIGADEIVEPEEELGATVARKLARSGLMSQLELGDDMLVAELKAPEKWIDRPHKQLPLALIAQGDIDGPRGLDEQASRHDLGGRVHDRQLS